MVLNEIETNSNFKLNSNLNLKQDLKLNVKSIKHNLSSDELIKESLINKEGILASNGALAVYTDEYTGRSPKDRYIVISDELRDTISWGDVNREMKNFTYNKIKKIFENHIKDKDAYVYDGYAGTDLKYGIKVRVITEFASQSLFAKNMFIGLDKLNNSISKDLKNKNSIEPNNEKKNNIDSTENIESFNPDYTVICCPNLKLDKKTLEKSKINFTLNSEAAVILNLEEKTVLIAKTKYSGEIKKSIFTILNYILTDKNVLPMHCSANCDENGEDTALFFGLSGTGKTTLSSVSSRFLIGDDEHGWSENGVFNFEGGCYAKCINLTKEKEPEIYNAIKKGAIMENVVLKNKKLESKNPSDFNFNEKEKSGQLENTPDYTDSTYTQNTRVSYPLSHLNRIVKGSKGSNPRTIIFLTADAYGVLPPISKLTPKQAMYHFISGYTSKVAGTERGIKEPKTTFSTCFGAPFMPRSSLVYAKFLEKKIIEKEVNVFLINTGWTKGPYGIGERIKLKYTRMMVDAALDYNKKKEEIEFKEHPVLPRGHSRFESLPSGQPTPFL